jgi:2-amino-4-hydroxy-6-hydroxymethyldihydropteridine diphosphokinase
LLTLQAESRVYQSPAVDYLNQPDFLNQVLQFDTPDMKPDDLMKTLLQIELDLGRKRDISKGPRIIDIDIIFWDTLKIDTEVLKVPHPSWAQRSFIVLPLMELPFSKKLSESYSIPEHFENSAYPL